MKTLSHDFVIVGAGPAGLQMAYFLGKAGRNYVVFEAAEKAASFFAEYPRHGRMISINKKHNIWDEDTFLLRHDWNSLLSDDKDLRFTNFSDDLYPQNTDVHNYLNIFAEKFKLNIKYNCAVKKISKKDGMFTVNTADGKEVTSRCVLMATGAVEENLPEQIEGIELGETYGNHDLDKKVYNNKQVLFIGGGNSSFESANHIAGNAGVVHVVSDGRIKFAWNTHSVGDLRAVNTGIIDMYHLKSMHSTIGSSIYKVELNNDPTKRKYKVYYKDLNTHIARPSWLLFQIDYDHVISSCGWRYMKPEIFDDSVQVGVNGRYPKMSNIWETDTENLFYIGTAMASIDRKSASGFVHGFRYNIRSLFQILEERLFDVELPTQSFGSSELSELANHVVDQVAIGDSLYQMNGFLCDVIKVTSTGVKYYSALPQGYLMDRPEFKTAHQLFVIYLAYGFDRFDGEYEHPIDHVHAPDFSSNDCASFLHPIIEYYQKGEYIDQTELHESLIARWDAQACPNFPQWPFSANLNYVLHFLNSKLNWTEEVFNLMPIPQEIAEQIFIPLTEEELSRMPKYQEGQKCKFPKELLPANPEMKRPIVLRPTKQEMIESVIKSQHAPPSPISIDSGASSSNEEEKKILTGPSSPNVVNTVLFKKLLTTEQLW